MEIELYLKNQLVVKANLPVTETPITPIPATKQDTPKIVLSPPGEVETGSGPRDELQMGILQAKSGLSREVLDLFGHDGESHEYSNVKIIKKEEYPTLKPNQFLESTSDPGETPVRISAEIVSDDWKPKSLDINESRNTVDESNVSLEKNDGATSKLTFRIARDRMHSKDYPKLDHLTFTDPQMAGFLEDLEDYSPAENAPEDENLFVDIPKPDLLELPKDERLSIHSFRSGSSHPDVLPREMMYKCPPFRAIPKWFPVKRLPFAWGLLGFTIVVSLANLVINGVFTAMGQS